MTKRLVYRPRVYPGGNRSTDGDLMDGDKCWGDRSRRPMDNVWSRKTRASHSEAGGGLQYG